MVAARSSPRARAQAHAAALALALLQNRTLVEDLTPASAHSPPSPGMALHRHTACEGRALSCYFHPLSSCSYRTASTAAAAGRPEASPSHPAHSLPIARLPAATDAAGASPLAAGGARLSDGVPAEQLVHAKLFGPRAMVQAATRSLAGARPATTAFQRAEAPRDAAVEGAAGAAAEGVAGAGEVAEAVRGLWFAALQLWLWKPTAQLLRSGHAVLSRLEAASRHGGAGALGMHVRHGDTRIRDDRVFAELSSYMEHARQLRHALLPQRLTLFVATDSSTVLGQLPLLAAAAGFDRDDVLWFGSPAVPRPDSDLQTSLRLWREGPGAQGSGRANDEQFLQFTSGIVLDIEALSQCNYFVGTCMSQVGRLATELMLARGKMRAAPVGLDIRVCRSFPAHFYDVEMPWRSAFGM